MSDRPENPYNEDPTSQGGWHLPREANQWQLPDTQAATSVAWREVKALPDEVDQEPEERGMWHLPDDSDTIFSPDDIVEIADDPRPVSVSAIASPEDLIAEILSGTQKQASVPNPEDFDFNTRRQPADDETSAADALGEGETLLVDELGDEDLLQIDTDDEAFSMSEYMALANLAQGDDDDLAGLKASDLSPAERALYDAALNTADEMDSKRIREPDVPEDATITMEDTNAQAASQAEDYARQQLERLNQGNEDSAPYAPQSDLAEPQAPQYSAADIQLAQQFRETKRQVAILRQMEQQGRIDPQELQVRLQEHTILDPQENWWMIGYETDEWYRYNNQSGQWEAAVPPVPLDIGQMRTETGLGEAAPDIMPGSLPYLPNDGTQGGTLEFSDQDSQYDNTQYSTAQQNYTDQYGVPDSGLVQYPNQPQNDPNLTQVGGSFDATQIGTDPTYRNLQRVDDQATMASDPFAGQQTVPSMPYTDDGYGNIEQADPTYADDGYNAYQPQAAPTIDAIEDTQRNQLLTMVGIGAFVVAVVSLLAFGGFVLLAMNQYNTIVSEWQPQIDALGTSDFDFQTATILAADGTIIAELTGEEGARTVVSIENGDVSPFFVHAIVSSEDPTFYENSGFAPLSIGRAFVENFLAGEITSGASTITQQIVRERILGSNVVAFDRKLTEVLLSVAVAEQYSKNEILDIYINEFFYGQQSYGVEAASEFYFDTTAADLDAAQAATLAAILPSPSDTNPVVAPTAAFSNMRVILNRMIDVNCLNFQHGQWGVQGVPFCVNNDTLVNDGQGGQVPLFRRNADGSFGGFLALQIAQVETRRYEPRQSDIQYPHFVFYVLGELDAAYGRGAYIERGFTVQTTLIPRIQNTAEAAIRQQVDNLALNGVQTGAALVTDPRTSAILAMVGSPDFNNDEIDGQNNNTISLQQPGSAIKPVVYASALIGTVDSGYFTPASILWDVTTQYNIDGTVYAPTNFDGRFRGPVPVRIALAQSLNVPAVKTYAQFGTQAFINTATALGIDFDPYPDDALTPTFGLPTAIGATEVTLLDLTHAYGIIANDGVRTDTYAINSITERNANGDETDVALLANLLHDEAVQAISPQVAYLLQNILSDDAARTATINGVPSTFPANSALSGAAYGLANQNQLAAKTGTNSTANGNPSRIWTMGFTNNYAVGVWLGTLNQATPMTGRVTGFTGAAPVWRAIMTEALNGANPGAFDSPSGVVQDAVCQLTGTLAPQASSTCPSRITEIFVQSQPPPAQDAGFVATLSINSWTGLRANQWCAENVVTETFANISDPFAVSWLNSTTQGQQILNLLNLPQNLQAPPAGECQQGQALPTVLINFPQENVQLQGVAAITGQVNANNLQRWELQISEVGTDNFRSIMPQPSTNQVPTGGTVLYEWDSRTVQNGAYILRLAAFANNGGFIFREVRITVLNPEPTPIPATATPFVIEITPIPFDLPTVTPDNFSSP